MQIVYVTELMRGMEQHVGNTQRVKNVDLQMVQQVQIQKEHVGLNSLNKERTFLC